MLLTRIFLIWLASNYSWIDWTRSKAIDAFHSLINLHGLTNIFSIDTDAAKPNWNLGDVDDHEGLKSRQPAHSFDPEKCIRLSCRLTNMQDTELQPQIASLRSAQMESMANE